MKYLITALLLAAGLTSCPHPLANKGRPASGLKDAEIAPRPRPGP